MAKLKRVAWEERGRELGKEGVSMREGRHLGNELECGVKGLVRWRSRRGAPLIREPCCRPNAHLLT
jgi:hypothetical protein